GPHQRREAAGVARVGGGAAPEHGADAVGGVAGGSERQREGRRRGAGVGGDERGADAERDEDAPHGTSRRVMISRLTLCCKVNSSRSGLTPYLSHADSAGACFSRTPMQLLIRSIVCCSVRDAVGSRCAVKNA